MSGFSIKLRYLGHQDGCAISFFHLISWHERLTCSLTAGFDNRDKRVFRLQIKCNRYSGPQHLQKNVSLIVLRLL